MAQGDIQAAFASAFADTDTTGNEKDVAKSDARALGSLIDSLLGALPANFTALQASFTAIFSASIDGLVVTDPLGFVLLRSGSSGLSGGQTRSRVAARDGVHTTDPLGFVIRSDGPRFSKREIAEKNARAMAHSALVRAQVNADTANFAWDVNHVIAYGQSLMAAQEGWPALTTTGRADCLMIGQSSRPNGTYDPAFVPVGDSGLHPLVATVQPNNGGAVLTPSQQAALAPGDGSLGETPLETAVIFCRQLMDLASLGVGKQILGTNVAVPGKTVEQLSPGANPNLFNRLVQAAQAGQAAATAQTTAAGQPKTYGIPAVLYAQGEFNYTGSYGGTTDQVTFATETGALFQAIVDQVATAVAAQGYPPLFVTYQTGAGFTNDAADMSIGMAQWLMSQNDPRIALATPAYPFPDKAGHLDPNGYRWMGLYFGKVLFEEGVLRRRWRPLEPIEAVWRGRQALLSFSVPHPPLQFQPDFVVNTLKTYGPKGFSLIDGLGRLIVLNAEIAADAVVLLTFDRDVVGQLYAYYGRNDDADGGGNLCDSDPLKSPFPYSYTAGSGQYASANIPQFVGKPYPLWNWSVQFKLPVSAG